MTPDRSGQSDRRWSLATFNILDQLLLTGSGCAGFSAAFPLDCSLVANSFEDSLAATEVLNESW